MKRPSSMARRLGIGLLLVALTGSAVVWAAVQTPLRIGFYTPAVRDLSQADLKVSLAVWSEEIAKPYNLQVAASLHEDLASMRRALDRNALDFVNAPGMELVELLDQDEALVGYARRRHGTSEGLALLVRQDSGIRSFADLRQRRVMHLVQDRLSEVYLDVHCLRQWRKPCRDTLQLIPENKDTQSVYAVFFGRVDAALVSLPTLHAARELNPQVGRQLRVLQDWPVKAVFFGMLPRSTAPAYRQLVLESVQEVLKTSRGRQLLELFKTDYLHPVGVEDLEPFRNLQREHRALLRASKGEKR